MPLRYIPENIWCIYWSDLLDFLTCLIYHKKKNILLFCSVSFCKPDPRLFYLQFVPSVTKSLLLTAERVKSLLGISKCVSLHAGTDFHPITPVSSSQVFSSDSVMVVGLCAASRNLATDYRPPLRDKEWKVTQESSRLRGVTLILQLQESTPSEWSTCCFQANLLQTLRWPQWIFIYHSYCFFSTQS